MIGWMIFAVYLLGYSVGMTVFAFRRGLKNPALCLIPFVAFFYADKLLGGYTVCGIKVESLGKLTVKLFAVALAAYLYARWGTLNLNEKNIEPLIQLMCVPVAFCGLIAWLGIAKTSANLLYKYGATFKSCNIACALLLPVPFVLMLAKPGKAYAA